MGMNQMAVLLFVLFGSMLAIIAAMIVSMVRRGDERRQEILNRTCAWTFYILVGVMVLDVVWGVYRSTAHNIPMEGEDPMVRLVVTAVIYTVSLAVNKRKYGG